MTYYLKAAAIILRHPIFVIRHPRCAFIIARVLRRDFRLHWLRDVARGR